MAKDTAPVAEKKYYVLIDYLGDGWKKKDAWKKGDIVSLSEETAAPYVRARILLPFKTAVVTGVYKSTQEQAVYVKPKPTTKPIPPKKESKTEKKTLVKNSLRDAVQEKKEAQEPEPELEIKEEPTNETGPEEDTSSAAEDAIKKKIAAAKAKKK